MGRKKDSVAEARQEHREAAIRLVKLWVEAALRRYEEPSRVGVPKGDPIGFPKKKRKAAFFLALYPTALRLKDIAKLAGVSEGVLRVWRSQDEFKRAEREACKQLGVSIANTIEIILDTEEIEIIRKERESEPPGVITYIKVGEKYYAKLLSSERKLQKEGIKNYMSEPGKDIKIIEFDDTGQLGNKEHFTVVIYNTSHAKKKLLFPLLKGEDPSWSMIFFLSTIFPFFNSAVALPFLDLMARKMNPEVAGYSTLAFNLQRASYVHDEETLREWHKKPDILSRTRARITSFIDMLADPKAGKQLGEERMKKYAEILKKEMVYELNILTG
jgi:hypothetical protein